MNYLGNSQARTVIRSTLHCVLHLTLRSDSGPPFIEGEFKQSVTEGILRTRHLLLGIHTTRRRQYQQLKHPKKTNRKGNMGKEEP